MSGGLPRLGLEGFSPFEVGVGSNTSVDRRTGQPIKHPTDRVQLGVDGRGNPIYGVADAAYVDARRAQLAAANPETYGAPEMPGIDAAVTGDAAAARLMRFRRRGSSPFDGSFDNFEW